MRRWQEKVFAQSRVGLLSVAAVIVWGTGWADEAVKEVENNPNSIDVDIQTGNPNHLLFVGQENNLGFKFKNPGAKSISFIFDAVLTSYDGASQKVSGKLTLTAGATAILPIAERLPERGLWYVDYTLKPEEGSVLADRISFAYLDPAGPRKGPPNGMLFSVDGGVSSTENLGERDRDIELASLCGIDVCRCTLQFRDAEPEEGHWDEAAFRRFDDAVNLAAKRGMTVQFILCYNARWDAPPNKRDSAQFTDWLFSEPKPDAWRAYVRAVVNRYHDRVKYWEVWNEADIAQFWTGTSDQYLELLKIAHEEIKKIDPSLQVMTCGFAHFNYVPQDGADFIQAVAEEGAPDYDILAIHLHGPFDQFQYAVDVPLRDIRAKLHPSKPVYFNETAISRETGDHPPVEMVWEKLVYAWSKGAMGYTWYNLRDGYLDLKKGGHPWGMFTQDYYPTPTYVSYNTLVTYLRDKTYAGSLDLGTGFYAYRFAGSNGSAIVSWSGRDIVQALPSVLRVAGATRAFFVDPMGNTSEAPIHDDLVILHTDATPRMLIIEGTKLQPEYVGPLVFVQVPPFADPAKKIPLQVTLRNPFGSVKDYSLHLKFPGTGTIIQGGNYTVAANTVRRIELELPPLEKTESSEPGILSGTISYKLSGTSWQGNLPVSIRFGARIPSGNASDRKPDFDLSEKKYVINLSENDPNNQDLIWKGPEDLSAKVWLSRDAAAISIHAEVRDDHASPPPPSKIARLWDGDCIEFALSLGGQKDYWKFATALCGGKTQIQCWSHPSNEPDTASLIIAHAVFKNATWVYEIKVPRAALGCDQGWPDQMSFNFMANDCDNDRYRKQWIELAPGIGRYPFACGVLIPIIFGVRERDAK